MSAPGRCAALIAERAAPQGAAVSSLATRQVGVALGSTQALCDVSLVVPPGWSAALDSLGNIVLTAIDGDGRKETA